MSGNHNNHDGIRTDTQFSIFLVNKPGVLARVLQRIAQEKINVIALSIMEATEHGVLRLVVQETDRTRQALNDLGVHRTEQSVLTYTLPNRPGALADVVERLAADHINVHYAYCTTGAAGGKTLGIFKVSDHSKAMQVLAERKPRRRPENPNQRTRDLARRR